MTYEVMEIYENVFIVGIEHISAVTDDLFDVLAVLVLGDVGAESEEHVVVFTVPAPLVVLTGLADLVGQNVVDQLSHVSSGSILAAGYETLESAETYGLAYEGGGIDAVESSFGVAESSHDHGDGLVISYVALRVEDRHRTIGIKLV